MLQRLMEQQYGLRIDNEFKVGAYQACTDQRYLYMIIPIGSMDENSIGELEKLSQHLADNGDTAVCRFIKTKDRNTIVEWEKKRFCVIAKENTTRPIKRLGRKLAKFHHRGRTVPYEIRSISRIGMWKSFWEQRLDQMERVWNEQLMQSPENEFVRMFIESFPYYMGLAENAIQYLSDTEQDDDPTNIDSGTVCHERFSFKTWGRENTIKNPFDWVFDHCARDLAEWTRERYFINIKTYEPDLRQFFQDYSSIAPLSSFSWRLVYARLLFPLHYMECVEEFFITASEQTKLIQEERMKRYLSQSRDYEEFLKDFYGLTGAPIRRFQIPVVEWLDR